MCFLGLSQTAACCLERLGTRDPGFGISHTKRFAFSWTPHQVRGTS